MSSSRTRLLWSLENPFAVGRPQEAPAGRRPAPPARPRWAGRAGRGYPQALERLRHCRARDRGPLGCARRVDDGLSSPGSPGLSLRFCLTGLAALRDSRCLLHDGQQPLQLLLSPR